MGPIPARGGAWLGVRWLRESGFWLCSGWRGLAVSSHRVAHGCSDDAEEVEYDSGEDEEEIADRDKDQPGNSIEYLTFVDLSEAGDEEAEDGGDAGVPELLRRGVDDEGRRCGWAGGGSDGVSAVGAGAGADGDLAAAGGAIDHFHHSRLPSRIVVMGLYIFGGLGIKAGPVG